MPELLPPKPKYKKGTLKKEKRAEKRKKLLAMFPKKEGYYELHKGDNWYVRQWNANSKFWQVAKYTEESFRKYKAYNIKRHQIREELLRIKAGGLDDGKGV